MYPDEIRSVHLLIFVVNGVDNRYRIFLRRILLLVSAGVERECNNEYLSRLEAMNAGISDQKY